jgi:hypothetical protein
MQLANILPNRSGSPGGADAGQQGAPAQLHSLHAPPGAPVSVIGSA